MSKINLIDFRDVGGVNPRVETLLAIYQNFEMLVEAIEGKSKPEKAVKKEEDKDG